MPSGKVAEVTSLSGSRRGLAGSAGFTYLSLIILLAVISLLTVSTLKLGAVLQRSKAEQELLEIGAAFSDALRSYADATPPGQPPQPPSLKELLKDPRFPGTRRHLRKIFVDPMTGQAEWGITYLGEKTGVIAIYSLSNTKPIKVGNFPPRYSDFGDKSRISEWKFSIAAQVPRTGDSSPVAGAPAQNVPPPQQPADAPLWPPADAPVKSMETAPPAPVSPAPPPSPSEAQPADEASDLPAPSPSTHQE